MRHAHFSDHSTPHTTPLHTLTHLPHHHITQLESVRLYSAKIKLKSIHTTFSPIIRVSVIIANDLLCPAKLFMLHVWSGAHTGFFKGGFQRVRCQSNVYCALRTRVCMVRASSVHASPWRSGGISGNSGNPPAYTPDGMYRLANET